MEPPRLLIKFTALSTSFGFRILKFVFLGKNCLNSPLLCSFIAIPIVVRYRVLGFEESPSQESGVKILVYLMRLGNAIYSINSVDIMMVRERFHR